VLRSDPGRQNGLYWQVSAGEAPSPAGPFLAAASAEGYKASAGANDAAPYHGYIYRMLFAQGPAADGGAREYVADGKLTGGYGLLAYPADYGETGVMTFMVNQDGIVRERDLGPQTDAMARKMTAYNPDASWRQVQ